MYIVAFKLNKNFLYHLAQCVSLIFAILLPSVKVSLYFYSDKNEKSEKVTDRPQQNLKVVPVISASKAETWTSDKNTATQDKKQSMDVERNKAVAQFSFSSAIALIRSHFKTSYSNKVVMQWSIWWAIAMCGFLQVHNIIICNK